MSIEYFKHDDHMVVKTINAKIAETKEIICTVDPVIVFPVPDDRRMNLVCPYCLAHPITAEDYDNFGKAVTK